jgi:hypothetical protein
MYVFFNKNNNIPNYLSNFLVGWFDCKVPHNFISFYFINIFGSCNNNNNIIIIIETLY